MASIQTQFSQADLAGRIFDEQQLADLFGGSAARRYGLVNRSLKDGSLKKIRRGIYMLGGDHHKVHPFAAAQAIVPGSYVSFETALAHHGWIPERVVTTASVTPGRKTILCADTPLGPFSFYPLALHDYQFLAAIERLKLGKLIAYVAHPLRALMDLVAHRKVNWTGLDWLVDGMRIDETSLTSLGHADFEKLKPVYKHRTVREFLFHLEAALLGLNEEEGGQSAQ